MTHPSVEQNYPLYYNIKYFFRRDWTRIGSMSQMVHILCIPPQMSSTETQARSCVPVIENRQYTSVVCKRCKHDTDVKDLV